MKMKIFLFFAILLATTLFSCKGKYDLIEKHNENGILTESYHLDKETGYIEGVYYKYFPNGKIEQQSDYKNNKLEGNRILFYENGDTLIIETYKNAQYEGPYKSYYSGNILESEGQYVDGMMDGEWKFYHDNKQIKEIVQFKANEENGPFVEYHKNGNLKAKGSYRTTEKNIDGNREDGKLELYNEDGVLFKKMDCELGTCVTTWKREES
jgi:antitoxin component YwqK of YwqJK toxin-antitoxin module